MAKHTILLVDDERNILSALSRLLRSEQREIITAENSTEAWQKLKAAEDVDLIISDNRLPDISGIEFLTKVRQSYPDTIRILITGYPGLESAIKAINNGQVYRYIPKPWENEELKMVVKQALDYQDVLSDNRILLRIARKQADVLMKMQKKYPQLAKEDIKEAGLYMVDEQRVSSDLERFMKKYYPPGTPNPFQK